MASVSTWWHCLAHISLSVLMGRAKILHPSSFLPEGRVPAKDSSGSPQRRANNHPFCVPSFYQIPAFTFIVSELPSCKGAQYSGVLSQACSWVSKIPSFRDLHGWVLADGSHCTFPVCWFVPQRVHTTMQLFRVCDKAQEKAGTQAYCPQPASLFLRNSIGWWYP